MQRLGLRFTGRDIAALPSWYEMLRKRSSSRFDGMRLKLRVDELQFFGVKAREPKAKAVFGSVSLA